MQAIQETLITYLQDDLLVSIDDVKTDQNLLAAGVIDSFGFIEMIGFLEKEFQIRFSDDEIQEPGIATIAGITNMISAKQKRAA